MDAEGVFDAGVKRYNAEFSLPEFFRIPPGSKRRPNPRFYNTNRGISGYAGRSFTIQIRL
ncbi:MAG: hypothetical protein A4E38_00208 [Methanoregulaceae archaeon PtaB.Bin108]|nr:MAG: hypothetical protein A4E38_00208 [Methanoregulaceae archaeon PtaB.Bin108]OPY43650.1 MAG: hypothetical protein A4E42_01256 [Methanoregulaceae archaeon PtaU1.Bin222]